MRVTNNRSAKLIGHLSDISTGGFRLDCQAAVPNHVDYELRVDVPEEIATKNFILFMARSMWSQIDPLDHVSYNAGFKIVNMAPEDLEIFSRMCDKYGTDAAVKTSSDYLWR
jgi:hypothetical protein